MPIGFNPGFTIPTEILQGFPQFRNFFEGRRGFLSSNNIAAGLDGSSAGPYAPSGTPPSYHLHFLTIGAFENFDFNIAAYHETESPLYRLPRNIVEFVLFNNVYIHQLLCELSGLIYFVAASFRVLILLQIIMLLEQLNFGAPIHSFVCLFPLFKMRELMIKSSFCRSSVWVVG